MKLYRREIVYKRLLEIFDEPDAETVLTWLISNDRRLPVVVVGAGFTLNAENKRTKLPASRAEVPLWKDVLERFVGDLRIQQSGYDALTFAELYYEEMEPAAFNSTLLGMLKDEDLVPGKAHRALFDYPAAAIVTTNHLDTLLDKNERGWIRVAHDPDLALLKEEASTPELIYFHGHRDDRTSWVFTRSQYEDIHRTRPLIVTKVRQLLSQSPVLIVGYSLSDPDFHHIYRQISLDMAYHHPLGLALFPNKCGPTAPERRHWEKLGIRIATFNKKNLTAESFEKFFRINFSEGDSVQSVKEIEESVRAQPDFEKRRRRAEDFLSDPDRTKVVRTDSYSEYGVWLAVLGGDFTKDDWEGLSSIYSDDSQYSEVGTNAPVASRHDSRSTFKGFHVLPRNRFGVMDTLSRQIDAFLKRNSSLKIELAGWMMFALEQGLIRDGKSLFVDLLSWIWRAAAGKRDDSDSRLRDEASAVIKKTLAIALAYGYQSVQKHIREDAEAIGLDVSGVGPADARNPEFIREMKEGFDRMLNGVFPEARKAYEKARAIAQDRGEAFNQWVACHGEADAAAASINFIDQGKEEFLSTMDRYRRRLRSLEQAPEVKEWLELARHRRDKVTEKLIERFIEQRRRQSVGGKSFSWSNYVHEYWTTFRDLETIHASPRLQREYIQPLIDLGGFPPEQELRYRLQLDVDKTEKTERWLSRIISDPRGTLDERRERDEALMTEFTRSDTTKFERVGRLEFFPQITEIFRVKDLDWAASFLLQCKNEFGDSIQTHASFRILHSDYAAAWGKYAQLELRLQILDHLEAYASSIDGEIEADRFSKALRSLPLEQWVGLHDTAAERLVHLVLDLDRKFNSDSEEVSGSDENLGWALYSVVHAVKNSERSLLDATWEEVRKWADRLLHKKVSDEKFYQAGALNTAVHVAWMSARDDAARDAVVKEALARTTDVVNPSYRTDPDLEGPVGVWVSLIEAGVSHTSPTMAEAAVRLWKAIDAQWDALHKFLGNNPHHAWTYVTFLADVIALGLVEPLDLAQERLLAIVSVSPENLLVCAKSLDPRYWAEHWKQFVDQVWKSSGGANDSDPITGRIGAVDLLQQWLAQRAPTDELSPDLGFLVDATLMATVDQSEVLANHAAYNVVGYAAQVRDSAEIRRVMGPLRRLALDPRLVVRGAAAYGGKKLQLVEVADEIRAVAVDIDKATSQETYAMIERQRRFGELDGKRPSGAS